MKAAVLTAIGQPLEIADLELPPMNYGSVCVRVLASGICGAQLQEIDGRKGNPAHLPRLLGHEGVGRIINVPAQSRHRIGEKVILHWRKGEGAEAELPFRYQRNGRDVVAGPVTTFNEIAVVSENRVTVVPEDTPNDFCAMMGCGLSTALMTIEHEANLLMGERILVIGCGGLGLNLILAAKMRLASSIFAFDIREKGEAALAVGATRFLKPDCPEFPERFDVIIDTSGDSKAIACCLRLLAPSGRFIMVGQPRDPIPIMFPRDLFQGDGQSIRATQGGGFNPSRDIPRYVRLWQSGQLKLDGIITHRLSLDEINDGIQLVRNGRAGRVLIEMDR